MWSGSRIQWHGAHSCQPCTPTYRLSTNDREQLGQQDITEDLYLLAQIFFILHVSSVGKKHQSPTAVLTPLRWQEYTSIYVYTNLCLWLLVRSQILVSTCTKMATMFSIKTPQTDRQTDSYFWALPYAQNDSSIRHVHACWQNPVEHSCAVDALAVKCFTKTLFICQATHI